LGSAEVFVYRCVSLRVFLLDSRCTYPYESAKVGRMNERVEWMMECNVKGRDRNKNADWDNVANVRGRQIKIASKVVSLRDIMSVVSPRSEHIRNE